MGAKIFTLDTGRLTFKDSLYVLSFSLSAFASTFGLMEEKKGFFPYFFNTETSQSYEGSCPAKEHYDPESMMLAKRREFDQSYNSVHDKEVNLYEERNPIVVARSKR